MCLKNAVDEPLSGARFPAGPLTVSGADALAFVRQRHGLPEGDLSRIRRQQVFLAAVADKVLAGGTLTDPAKLAGLVQVAQQSVVLDEGWDLLAFARQASGIAAGNLEFVTVPTGARDERPRQRGAGRPGTGARLRRAAQRRQEEAARAPRRPPPRRRRPPPPLEIEAPHYVVHVRNGSGVNGLAGRVLDRLTGLGFVRGTVDNTGPSRRRSSATATGDDAAEAVAEQLGGFEVEQDDTVPSGHLQVVLGADAPAMIPGLPAPRPRTPAAAPSITAAGVPCID